MCLHQGLIPVTTRNSNTGTSTANPDPNIKSQDSNMDMEQEEAILDSINGDEVEFELPKICAAYHF